jgi:hypothetical protein
MTWTRGTGPTRARESTRGAHGSVLCGRAQGSVRHAPSSVGDWLAGPSDGLMGPSL